MTKQTISVVVALAAIIFMAVGVEAANPSQSSDKTIDTLTNKPALKYMARDVGRIGGDENRSEMSRSRTVENNPVDKPSKTYGEGDNWLIYWYVCGTDLETGTPNLLETERDMPGHMTRCINEIEQADISSGKVKIFMQAGGTSNWQHPNFKNNNGKVGYYLYDNSHRNWEQLEPLIAISDDPKTQMSSRESLQKFLDYGKKLETTLYPDGKVRRVFIFADHGGGSLVGVCQDEYTNGKTIGLKDIHDAFEEVWGISETNPSFELVALDTCLMSTYETAVALKGTARYMVASEESIVSRIMFEYTGLLSKLSAEPKMSGKELGQVVCDTFWKNCLNDPKQGEIGLTNPVLISTMSVTDLSRMPALESAYENFGRALYEYAKDNPAPGPLGGSAENAEKYGDTILDLQHFAVTIKDSPRLNSASLKKASDTLIRAIDGKKYKGAVVYNEIRGRDRKNGGGLSTFYPFIPDKEDIDKYKELANFNLAPKSQSDFYYLRLESASEEMKGSLPSDTNASKPTNNSSDTNAMNPSPPKGKYFDLSDLEDIKVTADGKTAKIKLTQEQMDRIASVRCILMHFSYEIKDGDLKLNWKLLGDDTAIKADWKKGTFESAFKGKWISIEDEPVFVSVVSESNIDKHGKKTGSELYSVPIELNNRMCSLLISCKYPEEDFSLVGARPDTNSNVPTGELYGIKKGDIVKPKSFGFSISLKNMYEPLKEFLNKYPELETYYLRMPSTFDRKVFFESWLENLSEDERKEVTKEAYAFGEKIVAADVVQFKPYLGAPLTISDTMKIENSPLPDGGYAYCFEFVNPVGGDDVYTNSNAVFLIKNKEVQTAVSEEYMDEFINILITAYYKARKETESAE